MIRFALILLMSLAVTSQAVAAVKWNNPVSKEEKAIRESKVASHWTKDLDKVFNYHSQYIQGINDSQKQKIMEIGDPLECMKRVRKIEQLENHAVISSDDYLKDPALLHLALRENKITILEEGIYKLQATLPLSDGNFLIGKGKVVLDASNVSAAINIDKGFVANLTIYGAQKYGINIDGNHSTVFNVIIMNTGINSPLNSSGNGINARGVTSHSNCLVSVEAFNGYNEVGASNVTQKGGNADGIAIKRGAHNFTLIDVHAHHNSDDGYDFWKAGNGAPISEDEITIRLFYSSANHNGKNPLTQNGDGNGFKFGSADKYQKPQKDKGARAIYGSVACNNLMRGFDRNGTRMTIIAENNQARSNPKSNYKEVFSKSSKDAFSLKCKQFPKY